MNYSIGIQLMDFDRTTGVPCMTTDLTNQILDQSESGLPSDINKKKECSMLPTVEGPAGVFRLALLPFRTSSICVN